MSTRKRLHYALYPLIGPHPVQPNQPLCRKAASALLTRVKAKVTCVRCQRQLGQQAGGTV